MSNHITLSKGARVSLSKEGDSLNNLIIGLGWAPRKTPGVTFDLDGSTLMLDENGKVVNADDYIYYHHKESACKSVTCGKDNQTGDGEGDDEQMKVNLSLIPARIHVLRFVVHIHEAIERGQNFGLVDKAYFRIEDADKGETLYRFDLSEDYSTETGVVMAEVYRHDGGWKVRTLGTGYNDGLIGILTEVGLTAG
jgi:tellurium resistance protein TerD